MCQGNERGIEQLGREQNVIARIEAEFALLRIGDIFSLRSGFSYLALVLDGGRKEAARLQGKAKSN